VRLAAISESVGNAERTDIVHVNRHVSIDKQVDDAEHRAPQRKHRCRDRPEGCEVSIHTRKHEPGPHEYYRLPWPLREYKVCIMLVCSVSPGGAHVSPWTSRQRYSYRRALRKLGAGAHEPFQLDFVQFSRENRPENARNRPKPPIS
jgi:hypothetical protein